MPPFPHPRSCLFSLFHLPALNMCLENQALYFGVLTGSVRSAAGGYLWQGDLAACLEMFVQKAHVCSLNFYAVDIRLAT